LTTSDLIFHATPPRERAHR